jgi:hypothetical protein
LVVHIWHLAKRRRTENHRQFEPLNRRPLTDSNDSQSFRTDTQSLQDAGGGAGGVAAPEHAFGYFAEAAIAKLRQRAIEEDAAVSGKGRNFRTLANRIEHDLLPRWGRVAITAITEHALNDWVADDLRVEDVEATVAEYARQPRDAARQIVWKQPSQTTLGNLDWAFLHVWQKA